MIQICPVLLSQGRGVTSNIIIYPPCWKCSGGPCLYPMQFKCKRRVQQYSPTSAHLSGVYYHIKPLKKVTPSLKCYNKPKEKNKLTMTKEGFQLFKGEKNVEKKILLLLPLRIWHTSETCTKQHKFFCLTGTGAWYLFTVVYSALWLYYTQRREGKVLSPPSPRARLLIAFWGKIFVRASLLTLQLLSM